MSVILVGMERVSAVLSGVVYAGIVTTQKKISEEKFFFSWREWNHMSSVPSLAELAQHDIFERIADSEDTWAQVVQARKEKKKRDLQKAEEEVESLNRKLEDEKKQVKKLKAEIKGMEQC